MKMLKLQFEVDEDANEQIVSYMVLTKVKTKREYINNALALLRWAIDARIEGRSIASVDEGHTTYRQITMPILEAVTARVKVEPTAKSVPAGVTANG